MAPTTIQMIGATLFAIAILHTFSTKYFEQLAHRRPQHAGLWHLLGEVEVVFGFWAGVLFLFMVLTEGSQSAIAYIDSRNYTEPMFVFAIMVVAASKPVLRFASTIVDMVARYTPLQGTVSTYFTILAVVPLLGSLITEPAAMTLAALMLRDGFFRHGLSTRLKYATLGLLFVNISIGGTLTNFAAPPVLMVATKWQWDTLFMLSHFGWKAAFAVVCNALLLTWFFRHELAAKGGAPLAAGADRIPVSVAAIHVLFLVGVVAFAHHPVVFMGVFLLFLGYAEAYKQYQERLILREGLLVAFFLAGLVVLGGLQQWWLQQALTGVEPTVLYFLATALTAVTDNAALTYLASLVEGVTPEFKYAIVAGAVTGGGLTVIANAPNPAGLAILKGSFDEESVSPLGLLLAALPPTCVAIFAFLAL